MKGGTTGSTSREREGEGEFAAYKAGAAERAVRLPVRQAGSINGQCDPVVAASTRTDAACALHTTPPSAVQPR